MTAETAHDFATLNAALNGASALLALIGWRLIRAGRIKLHATSMLAAVATSTAFLASYVYLHYNKGYVTRFPDLGWIRTAYRLILVSHTLLAAVVPPLVLITAYLAIRRRWPTHRRLARWTLPIWLYVSVTGVIIYAMLYHLAPALIRR